MRDIVVYGGVARTARAVPRPIRCTLRRDPKRGPKKTHPPSQARSCDGCTERAWIDSVHFDDGYCIVNDTPPEPPNLCTAKAAEVQAAAGLNL
jgi:hypothetical protein